MKRSALLMIFILVFSGMTLVAQEDVPDDITVVYMQEASSGEFVDNGDETYTLTLHGIGEEISFLKSQPILDSGFDPTAALFTGWSGADDLTASETLLRLEDGTISLTLSNPVYDPVEGTISYTATAVEVDLEGQDSKKGISLPESFEEATLFILIDREFGVALLAGYDNAGLRTPGASCANCNLCQC